MKNTLFLKIILPLSPFLFLIFLSSPSSQAQSVKPITQAKEEQGEQMIEGFVTALPGQLGRQYFYLQDETSGIQGYKYDKNFPLLTLGQKVRVLGEVYESRQEFRIKAESIEPLAENRLSSPKKPPRLTNKMRGNWSY